MSEPVSAFQTSMTCALGYLECLAQNYWLTPPYGPVPDASQKAKLAVQALVNALNAARDAEAAGAVMPPLPEYPADQVPLAVRAEHQHMAWQPVAP